MKRFMLVSTLVCCLGLLSACGSAAGAPPQVTTHFSITAQASAVAGTVLKITVTALDASNQTVTAYSGTVHLISSDARAVLPAASTLASGTGTFAVTLMTPGTQTITATDTASITGTSNSITVTVLATHFAVTGPSNATTGISFSFTVTALDASNNTVTTYSGTVHFTSTDTRATLPASSTLTNGTGMFSATLKTFGSQTMTATDTVTASITGTSSGITVGSAAPTHFAVQPALLFVSPGSAFNFSVTALDAANNPAPTYAGTVHFTSTDALASLPANSTPTNGTGSFSATLNTLGYQTITATDTVTPSITGTSNAVEVFKLTITSGNPPNGRVGVGYGPANECLPQGFILSANGVFTEFDIFTSTSLPPGLLIGKFLPSPGGGPDCRPSPAVWMVYGTPTQAGVFNNVVITVHFGHTTASATYTITINAAAATRSADSASTLDSTTAHHHYKLIDLGTFGGPQSYFVPGSGQDLAATSVLNSRGTVAGFADTSMPDPFPSYCFSDCYVSHTFEAGSGGVLTDVGALPGGTDAEALLINERGEVVGFSYTSSVPSAACPSYLTTGAFIWDKKNGIRDLGGFGGTCTTPSDLNNKGQIVGQSSRTGDQSARAFLWENGSIHELRGSLGGHFTGAFALSEKGEAVGYGTLPEDNTFHATLWKSGKSITDLGVLGTDACSFATAINAKMQVVGDSSAACNDFDDIARAFLWEDGSLFDLNSLIPPASALYLEHTYAINDRGEIAGTGLDGSGNDHAFLLVPCDENHPGIEGCDYGMVDGSAATVARPRLRPASGDMPLPLRSHRNNRLRFPAFGRGN